MSALRKDMYTDDQLWRVSFYCQKWANWVNSDRLPVSGYQRETSESATQYDVSESELRRTQRRWGKTDKTSKSAKILLPDWKVELAMDAIINSLNIEYRRAIYCRYEVRLTGDQLVECRIPVRRMYLLGRDGRYSWPRYKAQRLEALNIPSRTFDRTLRGARYAILADERYQKIP